MLKYIFYSILDGGNATDIGRQFFAQIDKTDLNLHFKEMNKIGASRVLKEQISMIHRTSGMRCLLLFDSNDTMAKSSEIVKKFFEKDPNCKI